jgi:WS/DGAT/MGAT family acyltransferase
MNPLDGVFLSMETAETPTHVGGLAVLDTATNPNFDFDHFRDFVAERVALCPRFGWRVSEVPFGLDLPYWVSDEALDFNEHVRRAALPSPGGSQELADLAGHLFAMPLDRSRPLWEMYLIEGLQGGRVALLWKVHHCLMDGVSGAGLMELLFDPSPEPAPRASLPVADESGANNDREQETAAPSPPSWDQMLGRSIRNAATRNVKLGENLLKLASDAIGGNKNTEPSEETPRVSFNGTVGARRAVAWTSVPMAHVKAIKDQLGVTVNDVILGLTSGSVREYLASRGELPETSLKAVVPVSTREPGDQSIGNQIRDITVDWATDLEDPIERIMRIHKDTTRAKNEVKEGGVNLIEGLAESLPPAATRLIMQAGAAFADRVPLPGNAVVSNVRMPSVPFYIAGAKIVSTIPISVLAPTQGLNITALSYCDEIYFGFTVDPRLVPNPWMLAEGTSKSLIELQSAMERRSSPAD